jgi:hypothetical protein
MSCLICLADQKPRRHNVEMQVAGGVAQADAWLERSPEVHKDPFLDGGVF